MKVFLQFFHIFQVALCVHFPFDDILFLKIFVRMENDVDVLWNCLVDQEKKYWFDVDFDKLPRNKKMILNLPKWCEASSSTSQPKLLRSQRIFNSSLSQHITKHDFNNSILRAEPAAFETAAIELDQVDVNDHECMPTICAFLNHLANKYSSTLQQIDTPPNFLRGVLIFLSLR